MEQRVQEFNDKMTHAVNNPKFVDPASMAEEIFGGSKELKSNEIIMMQLADPNGDGEVLFQMLLELVIHGVNVLSGGTANLFDLIHESTLVSGTVSNLNSYLEKFNIRLNMYTAELPDGSANIYREWEDYYCEIMRKNPNSRGSENQWIILDQYLVHQNQKFTYSQNETPLKFYRFVVRPKGSKTLLYFNFEMGNFYTPPIVPPERTTQLL